MSYENVEREKLNPIQKIVGAIAIFAAGTCLALFGKCGEIKNFYRIIRQVSIICTALLAVIFGLSFLYYLLTIIIIYSLFCTGFGLGASIRFLF